MTKGPDQAPQEGGGSEGEAAHESSRPDGEPWLGGALEPVALTAVAWTLVANQLPVETAVALAWLAIFGAAAGLGLPQGRDVGAPGDYRQVWREAPTRERRFLVVGTVMVAALATVLQVVAGTGVFVATGVSVFSTAAFLVLMWAPDLPDDHRQAIRARAVRMRRGVAIGLIATIGVTSLLPASDSAGHVLPALLALVSFFAGRVAGSLLSRSQAWRLELRGRA